MKRTTIACLLVAIPAVAGAQSGAAQRSGAEIYQDYCSVCHGDRGDGDSRAKGSMVPPPRDFTTPAAAVELTRERMVDAVRHGRPGTAMAGWSTQLSDEQVVAVVDYVRNVLMRPVATGQAEVARRLYAENCSVCHGDDGRGAKWTLTNMSPAPRNFRATSVAELPREVMLRTVAYGKANTAMPGFRSQLSDGQIAMVVDYIRRAYMNVEAGAADPGQPAVPALADAGFPDGLRGNAEAGQRFYLANCSTCHGVQGDGKGPRAYFILPKPRDFNHPASRFGLSRERLYRAIAVGVRGSEMPAWRTVAGPQEIADVAEYVYRAFIRPADRP